MKVTEDYVSYEVAKLLKEKGFDEYYPLWYNLDKPLEGPFFYKEIGWYGHNSYDYNGKRIVSAPTLQMACKWLRETYNKHCDVGYDIDLEWYFQIIDLKEIVEYDYPETKKYHAKNETGFKTYEEAVEAALKYTLENLI